MKSCLFQRARQPEQKAARRAAILAAAAELLAEQGFDAVSLNGIARHVGLAKSNVYRYFESREEIFLQLLKEDMLDWTGALEGALVPLAGADDGPAVARVVARSIAERPRLCQLVSVTASVLEQNLSEEAILRFKTETLGLSIRLVNALHAALPRLSVARLQGFLRPTFALVAGLWPMANPPEVLQRVLQRPEFASYCAPFDDELESALRTLLVGLMAPESEG